MLEVYLEVQRKGNFSRRRVRATTPAKIQTAEIEMVCACVFTFWSLQFSSHIPLLNFQMGGVANGATFDIKLFLKEI